MQATEKKSFAHAMAFYHQDGLPAAWKQAMKFVGKGGRLATMPDIVAARLETKPGALPWESYFTTLTAEYYGFSKTGKRILIIAHGVGPLSTLEGIQKAYRWEYNDKDRNRRGGRVTAQEFLDLEAGKFGDVSIVDLESYCMRYEYPFIQALRSSEAMVDPVLKARFGLLTEDYIKAHTKIARELHRKQTGAGVIYSDPYILKVDDASNCGYFFGSRHGFREIEEGMAVAHLISTSRPYYLQHHEGNESLMLDVGCHEWWDGVRLVGIPVGGDIRFGLNECPNAHELLRKHWCELLVPAKERQDVGFCALVKVGNQWFTQYPKIGERMDTGEPEFVVTSAKNVGESVLFQTTSSGSGVWFKFDIKEVQSLAPSNANAYFFRGEPRSQGGNHVCEVQFYQIEADTSKRMIRADKLAHDYDTIMKLIAKEAATA